MKKKIIFCSGGTGGHVFPAISMIDSLKNERDITILIEKRAELNRKISQFSRSN